jgi:hypothetical protein
MDGTQCYQARHYRLFGQKINHSPSQGSLLFQQLTELCQMMLISIAKISTGKIITKQWYDSSEVGQYLNSSLLAGSSLWILQLALWWWVFILQTVKQIALSCQVLSSKPIPTHWSLLQFKQEHWDLAVPDKEYHCVSNTDSPGEEIRGYSSLFTFSNFASIINM